MTTCVFQQEANGGKAGLWQIGAGRAKCTSGCENACPGVDLVRSCEAPEGRRCLLLLVFSSEVAKRQTATISTNGRFIAC